MKRWELKVNINFSKTIARKKTFTLGVKVLKNKSTGRFDCE